MKKATVLLIMTSFLVLLPGCSAGNLVERFVPVNDSQIQADISEEPEETENHTRVYMDEVRGTLTGFTGNQITMVNGKDTYTFDISQATLECESGMVSGDQISVIYEGQLESTDTSAVRALKVANTYGQDSPLEDQTFYGQLQDLTANTITLKNKDGVTAVFPATGIKQYYENGIQKKSWLYVHYTGNLSKNADADTQSGTLTQVVTISDVDPLKVASSTPTPKPDPEKKDAAKSGSFRGIIQSVQLNKLSVSVENTSNVITLDMKKIPCYFSGGITVGSHVKVQYTSSKGFNGTSTDGITLTGIKGEIPEKLRENNLDCRYSGTIIGSTGNTITVTTDDGMQVTCYTDDASNSSTGGLLIGSSVSITFNPAASRDSNILTALKITDI